MFGYDYLTALIRLVLAIILGGVIGFERAERGREAGLRTHIVVCLGAALVMLISEYSKKYIDPASDVTRLGAQVISGIGFLGVGCIITTGDKIKGLTTAAGLWTTACIGLAVGIGYYAVSITIVALMMIVMIGLTPIANKMYSKVTNISLSVKVKSKDSLSNILSILETYNVKVSSVNIKENSEYMNVLLDLMIEKNIKYNEFVSQIILIDGVLGIEPYKGLN